MKIVHWTLGNNSGLSGVAKDISKTEKGLGHDSLVIPSDNETEDWDKGVDADIYVIHSHFPDKVRKKAKGKIVFIAHGTPEHCFQTAIEQHTYHGYEGGNSFMLSSYWLRNADATVTFWPRHQAIWQSLTTKEVTLIPLGVDLDFWKKVESKGKWAGSPSIVTMENPHYIKWPLDLFFAWPWVSKAIWSKTKTSAPVAATITALAHAPAWILSSTPKAAMKLAKKWCPSMRSNLWTAANTPNASKKP